MSQFFEPAGPELKSLQDETLLEYVQQGDHQALEQLLQRYKSYVRGKAQTYYVIGGDKEDIIQEGMIGLYKAIRNFNGDKLASFRAFAELCITRQMITAVKAASRQKHIPLNSYISLDKPIFEDESERTLIDIIAQPSAEDPQEYLLNSEKMLDMDQRLADALSEFEQKVLIAYLDGYPYQEMSSLLNSHVKSIDNALQRVKRKLEKVFQLQAVGNDQQTQ